jgi:hypothetical protein
MAREVFHHVYVNYEIDDVEVILGEDYLGNLYFYDAKVGPFSIYTTREQREDMLKLAKADLDKERQENIDDAMVDMAFVRGLA